MPVRDSDFHLYSRLRSSFSPLAKHAAAPRSATQGIKERRASPPQHKARATSTNPYPTTHLRRSRRIGRCRTRWRWKRSSSLYRRLLRTWSTSGPWRGPGRLFLSLPPFLIFFFWREGRRGLGSPTMTAGFLHCLSMSHCRPVSPAATRRLPCHHTGASQLPTSQPSSKYMVGLAGIRPMT